MNQHSSSKTFRITAIKDDNVEQVGIEINCPFHGSGMDLTHKETGGPDSRPICMGFNSAQRPRCPQGPRCKRAHACNICLQDDHPHSKCKLPACDTGKCRITRRFAAHGGFMNTMRKAKHWCLKAHTVRLRSAHMQGPDWELSQIPDIETLDSMPLRPAPVLGTESASSTTKRRRHS